MMSSTMSMKQVPYPRLYRIGVLAVVIIPILSVFTALVLTWNHYVFWEDILLMLSLYLLTGLGVTIGFHRMLTHKSFETYAPIRAFFLILGCMTFEGAPNAWAATHIHHHAVSDHEGDPHSPVEGFWHAHFGWIFRGEYEDPAVYAPHLLRDPVVMFVNKYTWLWMTISVLLPFMIGGWTGLLWGGFVRIFIVNHVTWSVNSVCHTFGKRSFESRDESRNEWIVGLLAFGEGWHNNHHAFPTSAFHGLFWWQFDLSGLIIRGMERCGLVWKVEKVSAALIEAKKAKTLMAQLHDALAYAREELAKRGAHSREYFDAGKRLEEIRRSLSESSTLTKKMLQQNLKEVREVVALIKQVRV